MTTVASLKDANDNLTSVSKQRENQQTAPRAKHHDVIQSRPRFNNNR